MNSRLLVAAAVVLVTVAVPTAAVTVADTGDDTVTDDEGRVDITMAPHDGPNGKYATVDDGELELQFDRLNDEARTTAHDVFTITNTGDRTTEVWVTTGVDGVTVYEGDDPGAAIDDDEDAVELAPGESLVAGVQVDTGGADPSSGSITVHARVPDDDSGGSDDGEDSGGEDPGEPGGQGESDIVVTDISAPAEVTVGETATFSVTVENRGDAEGETTVELKVNGTVVDQQTVTVPAGERRTVTFERTFDRPGAYEIEATDASGRTESQRTRVMVDDPDEDADDPTAVFEVTDATVADDEIEAGESTEITATVENVGDADGETTVELVVGGVVVDQQTVSVPAGERRTVTFERTFPEAGVYSVAVGGVDAGEVSVLSSERLENRLLPSSMQAAAGIPVVALLVLIAGFRYRR